MENFYENENFGHHNIIFEGPSFKNFFKDNDIDENKPLSPNENNDDYIKLFKSQNARNTILNNYGEEKYLNKTKEF